VLLHLSNSHGEENKMLTVGDTLPEFTVTGVKPGFKAHLENGESAFFDITQNSFEGKWKLIYFYPKDFTFVCPTEIVGFDKLVGEFGDRECVVLGGSTDNEFCKLAWRREHPDLANLKQYAFADTKGDLVDGLGVREKDAGVALRATFFGRPKQHDPARFGQQSERGPQPGRNSAFARRFPNRRIVPVQPPSWRRCALNEMRRMAGEPVDPTPFLDLPTQGFPHDARTIARTHSRLCERHPLKPRLVSQ
jgi:alkyl hydroperoxide reductase subunit AhpC